MSVRLAFSVSAHLLSDILVDDEVLAVGDIAFQRKCLGKMDDVSKAGRTILFVSHNMPTVSRLCNRTILLDKGKIVSDGVTSDVIKEYLKIGMQGAPLRTWLDLSAAPGNDIVRLCSVRIITESGHTESIVDIRKPVGVEITYRVLKPGHRLFPDIRLFNAENIIAFASFDNKSKWWNESRDVGLYTSIVWIPGNLLSEGNFSIAASIDEGNLSIAIQNEAVSFEVSDPMEGDSVRGDYTGTYSGVVRPELEWETRFQKS
jgi:lipopolysaccharide transport system ATP-binding protein